MRRKLDDMAGRLLLRLAAVLHRAVASEQANGHWISRRDRALRAANRRGVPVAELAARLGLYEGWVRQVLNGRKPAEPPVIEEAT